MKIIGKIYSSVDADELEVGDLCIFANTMAEFTDEVKPPHIGTIDEIMSADMLHRFHSTDSYVSSTAITYQLAKLVCPKKHVEVYKAWKDGHQIETLHPCYDDKWVQVVKPSWAESDEYRVKPESEDPYAELKKAYAEGKTIQVFNTHYKKWTDTKNPYWDLPITEYRVKPELEKSNDMVNSPSHYQGIKLFHKDGSEAGTFEAIELIDSVLHHLNLTPEESGSMKDVLKYILRSGKKHLVEDQGTEDLEKAAWYLNHVIDLRKQGR